MRNEKKYLVIGIVIGVILSYFYFHFFAQRYEVKKMGSSLVKIDKWAGQSWRFEDNTWKKIAYMDRDWEGIDKTLRGVLQIPFVQVDSASALNLLRESHPILKEISDEDLLERIKLVYSKQILTSLYLSSFLQSQGILPTEQKEAAAEGEQ